MSASPRTSEIRTSSGVAVVLAPRTLTDPCGRRMDCVRVSVTDRCDLRCQYCLPEHFKDFQEPAEWLTLAEMTRTGG